MEACRSKLRPDSEQAHLSLHLLDRKTESKLSWAQSQQLLAQVSVVQAVVISLEVW